MYYTYVLQCNDINRNKFYIGVTDDIKNRVAAHKSKSVQTTKSFNNIKLIYCEICLNKTDALKREHQLKTGFGRGYINKRLENYLKEQK